MKKSQISVFVFSLLFSNLVAQINVEGHVLFKNKPVENVTIFLNNTTTGTITNSSGEFSLDIKKGFYQLIISHIGFKTIKYDLNTSTYTKPIVFYLTEDEFVLDEVVIDGTRKNDNRQYNLSVFIREFIGTSEFSKLSTILNPEVLIFDYDAQKNSLTVKASELLHIKNEALGYGIYYDLVHFSVIEKYTKYVGYSYFKELKGGKNKQRKWRKNRLIAYNGSPVHFFKSVLKNTAKKEGFIINQFIRKENKERPSQQEITKSRKILTSSNVKINFSRKIDTPINATDSALTVLRKLKLPKYIDYLYKQDIASTNIISTENNTTYLQFKDNLRIVYLNEKEEEGYILRNVFSKPREALPQASNIIPLAEKSIIYPSGILGNPIKNVLYEGYWSYEKFAHSLPLDYEPIK